MKNYVSTLRYLRPATDGRKIVSVDGKNNDNA